EADGGDGNAVLHETRAEAAERVGRAGTDVGLSVGEQDDAVDEVVLDAAAELFGTGGDAAMEIGAAAGHDLGDDALDLAAVADGRGGVEGVHAVVEGDEGDAVVAVEASHRLDGGVAGAGDLVTGHGAGFVDDEGEVDGGALGGGRGATIEGDLDDGGLARVGGQHGPVELEPERDGLGGGGVNGLGGKQVGNEQREPGEERGELAERFHDAAS